MRRIVILFVIIALFLSACSHEPTGLDKDSETYKNLMLAINGPDWTPEPTVDPNEANIQALIDRMNRYDPVTDYKKYARNPSDYVGDQISFNAEVVRAVGSLGLYYIVAMDGNMSQLFHIKYQDQRLLAGDLVNISAGFYGEEMVMENDGSYSFYPSCTVYKLEILN